jgi:HK97 family phage prohead protease
MKIRPHPKTEGVLERRSSPEAKRGRAIALEVKAVGDDGTFEGYGSVFGVVDDWYDVVVAGAFKQSLADHKAAGTMPAMLWQHDATEPIGIWLEMAEDAKGLKVKGKLALETRRGQEAYALLKMGAITGLSIGFCTVAGTSTYNDDGVRFVAQVDLWEVSLVTFPANKVATVTNVKSAGELAAPKDAERILRDAGFSKAEAKTFVSRVMRMGEDRREAADSTAQAMKAAERLLNSLTTS